MKNIQLYFHRTIVACCILVCSAATATAQQTMLMGEIVDAHKKPIPGAVLHLQGKDKKVSMATSDNMGLFTSTLMPQGKYHVNILLGKLRLKAGTIELSATNAKKYYYFTIAERNKVTVTASARNPYMETKLNEVAAKDNQYDFPNHKWRTQNNKSIYVFDSASAPKVMSVEEK
ncbi:MAG: carboxypeptidase-like regulatory domain-containing protein [Taibaiella sp.]|nr:carboxypeptidase-like regulatory domain-containing protein [Taibaiella sp.]